MEDKKTRTLFILGAGASYPYGFPLASGLRAFIINKLDSLITQYFHESGDWGRNLKIDMLKKANAFCNKFDLSDTQSIDLFLSRNSSYSEIGKFAIILSLLEKERNSKFRENCENPIHNWYTYLFRRMTKNITKVDEFEYILDNNYSFLTFNYDRSLEKYLEDSFLNSFSQIDKNKLEDVYAKINIHHIYGKLNDFHNIPYGVRITYNTHVNMYDDLISKIVTPYEFKKEKIIESEIAMADRIFILGFSYADENMKVLNIKETVKSDCRIICCTYDMSNIEIDALKTIYFSGLNVKYGDRKMDSLSLLKEYLDYKDPEFHFAVLG